MSTLFVISHVDYPRVVGHHLILFSFFKVLLDIYFSIMNGHRSWFLNSTCQRNKFKIINICISLKIKSSKSNQNLFVQAI